jgi:hypothetical protein
VAKVTVNGEVFEFDRSRKAMAEMITLEKTLGIPYGQWEAELQAGSARALAGFIWLVWHRNGRDVKFADIESGEVEIDVDGFDVEEDPAPEQADPTPPAPSSGPSSTGRASGSSRSPASASAPGKSGS